MLRRKGLDCICAMRRQRIGAGKTMEKAAQINILTAHFPRVNTIRDDQMMELAEYFGVKYRKDFLNL